MLAGIVSMMSSIASLAITFIALTRTSESDLLMIVWATTLTVGTIIGILETRGHGPSVRLASVSLGIAIASLITGTVGFL